MPDETQEPNFWSFLIAVFTHKYFFATVVVGAVFYLIVSGIMPLDTIVNEFIRAWHAFKGVT